MYVRNREEQDMEKPQVNGCNNNPGISKKIFRLFPESRNIFLENRNTFRKIMPEKNY